MNEGHPASPRNTGWIPVAVILVLALIVAAFIISGMLGDDDGGGGMDMDHGAGTPTQPAPR